MAVTQVGLNQQVYVGQQNGTAQQMQQNVPVAQPVPVGQPVPQGQTAQNSVSSTVYYPNNAVINNLPQSTNSYENDIMMQGIDFNKLAEEMNKGNIPAETSSTVVQNVPTNQQVPVEQQLSQVTPVQTEQYKTPTFTGATPQGQDPDGLTNYLVTNNEAAKEDKSKFKLGPTLGAVAGLATPFVCNKFKLGKFLSKDLMIKAPVMTVGGLCVGGIAEGLGASAKTLEVNNAEDKAVAQMMDVKA